MKKIIYSLNVALLAAFIVSCSNTGKEITSLTTEKDKKSYSIGLDLGNKFKSAKLDVDPKVVAKGISDAMAGGDTLISPEDFSRVMAELQTQQSGASGAENLKKAQEYMESLKKDKDVKFTESGLGYKVVKEGTGQSPDADDTVTVHYKGTLTDGTTFDSSYERNEPATFKLNQVIMGWQEGLQKMKEGGKTTLYVPPSLGYGERGAGDVIGPNQALVFEVELIKVEKNN